MRISLLGYSNVRTIQEFVLLFPHDRHESRCPHLLIPWEML